MTWAAYRSKDGRIVVHLAAYRVKFSPKAAKLFATAILLVVAQTSQAPASSPLRVPR